MTGSDADERKDSQAFVQMQINVAVLAEKTIELNTKFDRLILELRDSYARKSDVDELRKSLDKTNGQIDKTNGQIGWVIKIVLGLVIAAVIGTVLIKGGRP